MSTAELVPQSSQPLQRIYEPSTPILTAKQVKERQEAIWRLMAETMEKGVDYGKTPGCGDKNALFKPGSEKIMAMFQLAGDPLIEELSPLDRDRYGEFKVRVHSSLLEIGSKKFVGKGVGECSSFEEKYMWRRATGDGEFAYIQDINPELVRIKFSTKWEDGRAVGEYQIKQVRVPTADIANTVLKMAKKRAQIDAVLTATAASAIFTQDLEDMPEELAAELGENQEREAKERQRPQRKAKGDEKAQNGGEKKERDKDCISEAQERMLWAMSKSLKLNEKEIHDELKMRVKNKQGQPCEHFADIPKAAFQAFIDALDPDFKHHTRSRQDNGKDDLSNYV